MSVFPQIWRPHGGVHPAQHKDAAELESVTMPIPEKIVVSMSQHIGAPCTPTVKVGDTVDVGQIIGDSDSPISAPIHSSISGTVTGTKELLLPGGRKANALVITSDGERRPHASMQPPKVETFEEFIAAVRNSGIVGLGGAGFPMHVKLNPKNREAIDTLVINAAECEPYITADYRECLENSWDIISGIRTIMGFLGASRAIIGVESNKPAAIAVLSRMAETIKNPKQTISVKALRTRYPQGAEKVLIAECTGRIVPAGGLPADVGVIVMNVTSVAKLRRYLKTGTPLIRKRITVAGSAIEKPMNLRTWIGTPIEDVLKFVGVKKPIRKLLYGGPMMGLALMNSELPILKQNNAIIALADEDVQEIPASTCIRCGRCVDACPMTLLPTSITKAYMANDIDSLRRLSTMTCMECGCCTFSCPAHRPILQTIRMAKDVLRSAK
ncbi:MAG: electron transport complex subunit RsxC [Clostridia bacterium]|nr:electron transport complex subunit RsxC [Clostridia bacterium]